MNHRIFTTPFAKVYPLYIQKAMRKNRTKDEVDKVICWLTGYDPAELQHQIERGSDFEAFFANAPVSTRMLHSSRVSYVGSVSKRSKTR